jgi:hypothetical protein
VKKLVGDFKRKRLQRIQVQQLKNDNRDSNFFKSAISGVFSDMRLSLSTLLNRTDQVMEAELMLCIMKRYIQRQDYNFAASSEFNRLLWNYFQLEKHYLQIEYWKTENGTRSFNETALEVLTAYYLSHLDVLKVPKTKKETGLLRRLIQKFYHHLKSDPNKKKDFPGNDFYEEAGCLL